jgi:nucleoside-diphosphate-sugar epimerase
MTILTAGGSFAQAYLNQYNNAEIASIREIGETNFTKKISSAETIIHNAASIGCNDLNVCVEHNFDFTRLLVQKIKLTNPEAHLIFLGSMSILNHTNASDYSDVAKMTPYAYSKYLAETFCLKSELKNLSCTRFATLFYKDPKKDGLSKLIEDAATQGKITIFNNGEDKRNFLPINIAAQYVHKIVERNEKQNHVYNLVGNESTSFKDISELLKKFVVNLKVDNKITKDVPRVLSQFSDNDVELLGKINFSLENEIESYVYSFES